MGNGVATNQLMKMVAGAVNPGRPVANLYVKTISSPDLFQTDASQFSMWSHDVVSTSINLAGDLKMGQYLKIPPRVMFLTQVWGTILGLSTILDFRIYYLLTNVMILGAVVNYGRLKVLMHPHLLLISFPFRQLS